MKVVFRVEKKIGLQISPLELLRGSLEQFAALCDRSSGNGAPGEGRDGAPKGFFRRLSQRFGRVK